MKTWEMIKEISENPKKQYKRLNDGLIIRGVCGQFSWHSGYSWLGIHDEWVEVKESVDFMTAAKSGKE